MESVAVNTNDQFISMHRNQINPVLHPKSTLTFGFGDRKYGKCFDLVLGVNYYSVKDMAHSNIVVTVCFMPFRKNGEIDEWRGQRFSHQNP